MLLREIRLGESASASFQSQSWRQFISRLVADLSSSDPIVGKRVAPPPYFGRERCTFFAGVEANGVENWSKKRGRTLVQNWGSKWSQKRASKMSPKTGHAKYDTFEHRKTHFLNLPRASMGLLPLPRRLHCASFLTASSAFISPSCSHQLGLPCDCV